MNRYWVGGNGNWNDTGHWSASSGGASGALVPTPADDVIIDSNSSPGFLEINLDIAGNCKDIDVSNSNITIVDNGAFGWSSNLLSIYGSWLSTTTFLVQADVTFKATSAGKTVTMGSGGEIRPYSSNGVIFDGVGGEWMLLSDLGVQNANTSILPTVRLLHGSLKTNGYGLTTGKFESNNSNVRSLTLGSSQINLVETHDVADAEWDLTTTTNLTFDAGTSVIIVSSITARGCIFNGGGLPYYNLYLNPNLGTSGTLYGDNSFNNVLIPQDAFIYLEAGKTQTTTTFNAVGSASHLITFRSTVDGLQAYISMPVQAPVFRYIDVKDIHALGIIPFDDRIGGINSGNNTNWLFDTTLLQAGTLTEGATYRVSLNVGGSVGSVLVALDGGDSDTFPAGAGVVAFDGVWRNSLGNRIIVTPSADFNGTLDSVSIRQILSLDDWAILKTELQEHEWGFKEHLVNKDNEDFVYMCNRYDPYMRWSGAVTRLNGSLAGGETTIVVEDDGLLKPDVLERQVALASSATTLQGSAGQWVDSQWVNLYVKIITGALAGQIRKITANTSDTITFDTLGSDPLDPQFEIRIPKFPTTGSIIYGGTVVPYTDIPAHNEFTVASAAASVGSNDAVAITPTTYPGAPRGNRLEVHLTRMLVGNVRSALSRDSGGALQGSTVAGSVYVSKIEDATDFSFAATRAAGEGDIISTPYGGGDVTDIKNQESEFYIFKRAYVETDKYSQDANDVVVRSPLKPGIGSVGKVIRGQNDLFFMTPDHQITSISRVRLKDIVPQLTNIGLPIKDYLYNVDFAQAGGVQFRDRILISYRSTPESNYNDQVLLYNLTRKAFEGFWDLSTFGFAVHNEELYQAESNSPNVYKLFQVDKTDYEGTNTFPVTSEWVSNFFNVTSAHGNVQGVFAQYVEGYIRANTKVTFQMFKDLEVDPFLSYDFSGSEEGLLSGLIENANLGGSPIALEPLGAISKDVVENRRHFFFVVYFPTEYCQHLSVGVTNSGIAQDWEITRMGLALAEEPTFLAKNFKQIGG